MKVFISSVVAGLEAKRDAAARAIASLGHEVGRSEDFSAEAATPQQACLRGVRWADAVVLLLGRRYGAQQPSGLSATHEEYREARERRPVLAFVQDGTEREHAQQELIDEVERWAAGLITRHFTSADDLRDAVTRSLHDLELSMRAGEVDVDDLVDRATELIPVESRPHEASLVMVVTAGPRQAVLRASEIEDPVLERDLLRDALLGDQPVLTPKQGTQARISGNALVLDQGRASVSLDEMGSVRVVQPADDPADEGLRTGLPVLIEEAVQDRTHKALAFVARTLNRVDPLHRLSVVVPVLALRGAENLAWRTRAEHRQSPNSISIPFRTGSEIVVSLSPPERPRAALSNDTEHMTADFIALLRRRLDKRPR